MKLRTKSNSIRLRLTQSEVRLLQEKGIVEEVIYFPDGTNLKYQLKAIYIKGYNPPIMDANFIDGCITILILSHVIDQWAGSDEVSISGSVIYEDQEQEKLSLLVEKDFQCLSPRDEDEADMFPNPENM